MKRNLGSEIGFNPFDDTSHFHRAGMRGWMYSSVVALSFAVVALIPPASIAATILTGDHTIAEDTNANPAEAGNLTVEGALHVESQLDLGTTTEASPQAAVYFLYDESGSTYNVRVRAARDNAGFLWEQNVGGTVELKMKLDEDNILKLYDSTSGTAKITLDPNTGKISVPLEGGILLGDGTLVSGISNFRSTALYDPLGNPKVTVDASGNLNVAGEATFLQGIKANDGVEFAPGVALDQDNTAFLRQTLQNLGYREGEVLEDRAFNLSDGFRVGQVALDLAGNAYLAGQISFNGQRMFGSIVINGEWGQAFVAKLSSTQAVEWIRTFGGEQVQAYGIDVDSNGNIYVAGSFRNFLSGNGISLYSNAGSVDGYVLKINGGGSVEWGESFGGTDADRVSRIAVDGNGNVYVSGHFYGTMNSGVPQALISAGSTDSYIAKFNSAGSVEWAKSFGGTGFDSGDMIATDSADNVYVTGRFWGTVSGLSQPLVSVGNSDVYVAKFSDNGTAQWATSFGGTNADMVSGIALDSGGNTYVTGYFEGTMSSGLPQALVSAGASDTFVTRFDSSGTVLWAKSFGGTSSDIAYGLSASGTGAIVTGTFGLSINSGLPESLSSVGGWDVFVVKFSNDGSVPWCNSFGGSVSDYVNGVSNDGSGGIVLWSTNQYAGATTPRFRIGDELVIDSFIYIGTESSLAVDPISATPSFAWGGSQAESTGAVALGTSAWAGGIDSVALGRSSSSGMYSLSVGDNTRAGGYGSVAIGRDAKALGDASAAFGMFTSATGYASTASGYSSVADGYGSVALGYGATANGVGSVALGNGAQALGEGSVSLGASTNASGMNSFACGEGTYAGGWGSMASGVGSYAGSDFSSTFGYGTQAYGPTQHVVGHYNILEYDFIDDPYTPSSWSPAGVLFIIGNGQGLIWDDNIQDYVEHRSNAFIVRRNGDTEISGDLTVKGNINIMRIEPQGDVLMGEFGN